MKIIDISRTIHPHMEIYPGDTVPQITKISCLNEGESYNISHITLGTHTGTHVDPPLHLIHDRVGIDGVPLDHLVGNARVLDLSSINRPIETNDIAPLKAGEIILIKGGPGGRSSSYGARLTAACARYLIDTRIKTIGTNAISIGATDEEYEVHYTLLDAGIVVIEGLEMTNVKAGDHFLVCLPLKIVNGDGGPARAILLKKRDQYPGSPEY